MSVTRMCARLSVLIAFATLLALPARAFASDGVTPFSEVRSTGATGGYAQTNCDDRFPRYDEGYFICLYNVNHLRNDGIYASIAWEIYEFADEPGVFRPAVHIYWDDWDSGYYNDEYVWISPDTVWGNGTWRTMQVNLRPGSSVMWDCYADGAWRNAFYWHYPTGNRMWSALEVWKSSLTMSDYYFIGRNRNVHVRTASGAWSLVDTDWADRMVGGIYGNAPAYYISYPAQYYDWLSRR